MVLSSFGHEKLEELEDQLLSKGPALQPKSSLAGASFTYVNFATELFRRAPQDFLERTSISTLVAIVYETRKAFQEFLESGNKVNVTFENHPLDSERGPYTAITLLNLDRPFIVDSILELFRKMHISYQVLLHPILRTTGGKRISLIYIEIDRIEDEAVLENLHNELERSLHELALVTDDFRAMLVQAEKGARLVENTSLGNQLPNANRGEVADFLRLLGDGGFIFLGYMELKINQPKGKDCNFSLTADDSTRLGLFNSQRSSLLKELLDVKRDGLHLLTKDSLISFSKILAESPVHRRTRMELVTLRVKEQNEEEKILCFLGTLTSKFHALETSYIPVLRKKVQRLIESEGFLPGSHDYDQVVALVNALPKSELLLHSLDSLRHDVNMILSIQQRKETRVCVHSDRLRRFVLCTVIMPREKYSLTAVMRIQEHLESNIGAKPGSAEHQLVGVDSPLIRVHYFVPNPNHINISIDISELEKFVKNVTKTWDDELVALLKAELGPSSAHKLSSFYRQLWPKQYRATTPAEEALEDIRVLEGLTRSQDLAITLKPLTDEFYTLKIYKRRAWLTLSSIIPKLENGGFEILEENITPLKISGSLWAAIYNLRVRPKSKAKIDERIVEDVTLPGLEMVFQAEATDDKLNSLLSKPGISIHEIAIVRTLMRYLWQIRVLASQNAARKALIAHPHLTRLLVEFFRTKFDPDTSFDTLDQRKRKLEALRRVYFQHLKRVQSISEDRIFRAFLNTIEATVRTNAYRREKNSAIALKIDCTQITQMPEPRPLYEIFVVGKQFEGVHLRGGRIARGGIRWSDRPEDFRTEILGLMKTQMVKNSIIGPVGAKGGFVLKEAEESQAAQRLAVEKAYRSFISCLLELTDNLVTNSEGEISISPPSDCVIYDGDDYYLVVAADKGTATFSDIANEISTKDYGFWLGDAFASGGSNGYDHKKLGITARGAWESVRRHCREIGIDADTDPLTMVGIGDLSGDVFGNGLLRSSHIRLVAAFNHQHVFIDPEPDPAISYQERKRMFELPRSSWTDYSHEAISPGGGVYERTSKEIELSQEARKALGTEKTYVSGEELVRLVLLAPVDVLWNGGIGTYIKASTEDNLSVGDPSNNDVRVNATDVRAKIIGEGGNLGVTQKGRIEFAKLGHHINTDAVDNSGGVALSDMEVNLKIILDSLVARQQLTQENRNTLLSQYAEDCCDRVLRSNRNQNLTISLGIHRTKRHIAYYRGLLRQLESEKLNRKSEYLPNDAELIRRNRQKIGLGRPELSVTIGYVRMSLFDAVYDSSLIDNQFLGLYLKKYFPKSLVDDYWNEICVHPMRKEIIASQVANTIIEHVGASFIYRLNQELGMHPTRIIAAFIIADTILDASLLRYELEIVDTVASVKGYMKSLLKVGRSLDSMTRWFLAHGDARLDLEATIKHYQEPFQHLLRKSPELLSGSDLVAYSAAKKHFEINGFPLELANIVSSVVYASAYLDIAKISLETEYELEEVAKAFFYLAAKLNVTRTLQQAAQIESTDRWESLAVRTASSQLRDSLGMITKSAIEQTSSTSQEEMDRYLAQRQDLVRNYETTLQDFYNRTLSIPALMVISNQLRALSI